jgi:hypothetical protein
VTDDKHREDVIGHDPLCMRGDITLLSQGPWIIVVASDTNVAFVAIVEFHISLLS